MRVLVVAASKHGGTAGLARTLAEQLATHGLEVTVTDAQEPRGDVESFDAVVIGSAVYVGHWMKPAVRFVDEHHAVLSTRPVWLFSSGPLGNPPAPVEQAADAHDLLASLGARGHATFAGRLDRDRLSRMERATVRMVHAPYGDYRDLDQVRSWADEIAAELGRAVAG